MYKNYPTNIEDLEHYEMENSEPDLEEEQIFIKQLMELPKKKRKKFLKKHYKDLKRESNIELFKLFAEGNVDSVYISDGITIYSDGTIEIDKER